MKNVMVVMMIITIMVVTFITMIVMVLVTEAMMIVMMMVISRICYGKNIKCYNNLLSHPYITYFQFILYHSNSALIRSMFDFS